VLVHGQLRPELKDAAMGRFVSGEAQLLVATTVIEVGVDVPNATLMVIEQAERFGLAQLHQLRGRVGRGKREVGLSASEERDAQRNGRERLALMRETQDGFRLAEEDLRLRGVASCWAPASRATPVPHCRSRADHAAAADGQRRRARSGRARWRT
jgi:ATP-dependent DNA helicase RecG